MSRKSKKSADDFLKRSKQLRDRIRKRTGIVFDSAQLVRDSREERLRQLEDNLRK